jgi:hypothetical protein
MFANRKLTKQVTVPHATASEALISLKRHYPLTYGALGRFERRMLQQPLDRAHNLDPDVLPIVIVFLE